MKQNSIIYQMALRSFTPEGTLRAAEKLLPYVASLKVDIVYLCPVFKAGNDEDTATWSPRQRDSHTGNPKNPYKIADYFHVDEEYGSDEDLKAFVAEAHRNGLKVLFDLVYLHCDRHAVFIKEHPDFVEQNEDGTPLVGETWPFARLNFKNPRLREYLLHNMETFVRDYQVDGFRCDVGDGIPLDFWQQAFDALKKINPDLITLNEGASSEYLKTAFDMGYGFEWSFLLPELFSGKKSAGDFKEFCTRERETYGKDVYRLLRAVDNHDIASDSGLNRKELVMTSRGVEAAMFLNAVYGGIPFIWNGCEIADNAENCMFSNRFYGKRSAINWSRAFTAEGLRRTAFVRQLNDCYHHLESLYQGSVEWVENDRPEQVISFVRRSGTTAFVALVNTQNRPVCVSADVKLGRIFMKSDAVLGDTVTMGSYGYLLAEVL